MTHLLFKKPINHKHCLIGFDGFIDLLQRAVSSRSSAANYSTMTSLKQFGERIIQLAGKSGSIELIPYQKKMGGNAPLFAYAMTEGPYKVTCAGYVGNPQNPNSVFHPLAQKCDEVISLGESAQTDAIEFQDGKLFLGKHALLHQMNAQQILDCIGKEKLCQLLDQCDLFASVNWSMLMWLTDFWDLIAKQILPKLGSHPRYFFVDWSDPSKRSDKDMLRALKVLETFTPYFSIVIGFNLAEAQRFASLFGKNEPQIPSQTELASCLLKNLPASTICLHSHHLTTVAHKDLIEEATPPPCDRPFSSTGAGDHFNAGFCHALLHDLPLKKCLSCAIASSGFYIRQGKPPTLAQLEQFIVEWETQPQLINKKYLLAEATHDKTPFPN